MVFAVGVPAMPPYPQGVDQRLKSVVKFVVVELDCSERLAGLFTHLARSYLFLCDSCFPLALHLELVWYNPVHHLVSINRGPG